MEIKIGGKTRFDNLLKQLIIPFALVGYEVIITNSRYALLVGYFITSYPTRARGIIVIYHILNDTLLPRFWFPFFQVHFSWMFFIGTIPTFVSFFAVALLTHYGDWDPVLVGLKKLVNMNQQVIERCAEPTANYDNVTKKIVFKPLKYSGI